MAKPKPPISEMSPGEALDLNKINEIIAKANDRRLIAHVTSVAVDGGNSGALYGTNDTSSIIRIEARTVKTTTGGQAEFGGAWVAFTSPTAFSQTPLVVCSWGDLAALNSNEASEGKMNPPVVTPRNISREGFMVYGARQFNAPVRINYIAIGPT